MTDEFPQLKQTSERTVAMIKSHTMAPNDVTINSFMKSGTTWLQGIVFHVLTRGELDLDHISYYTPYLEADNTWNDDGTLVQRERAHAVEWQGFNTHFWPEMLPKGDYRRLYIVRSPLDVCISHWHYFTSMAAEDVGRSWRDLDHFVDDWVAGMVAHGAWSVHVLKWLDDARRNPRTLILRYEDLKADLESGVRVVAAHLGVKLSPEELEKVLPKLSFDWMKKNSARFESFVLKPREGNYSFFFRKGEVGDSKNHLTEEQSQKILNATTEARRALDEFFSAKGGQADHQYSSGPAASME
mmetsp:Transcript_22583/g.58078  ORF Transcript_22583/g.58078 Transcript_22583/m.58078 type:complete len:299 (-) Transcript_22583:401-1297(-)